jgi:hypothetical protein
MTMWRRRDSILMLSFVLLLCGWVWGFKTPIALARFGSSVSWQLGSSEGQIALFVAPYGHTPARGMVFAVGHNFYSNQNGPKDIDFDMLGFTLAHLGSSRGSGDVISEAYTFVGIPYWMIETILAALFVKRLRHLRRTRRNGFEVVMLDQDSKPATPQKRD